MNDVKNMHNELDPHLQRMLTAYGITPERHPDSARRTRAAYMAELNKMFVEPTRPSMIARGSIFTVGPSSLHWLREILTRSITKRSTRFVVAALLVMSIYLLSAVGITASAASSSLPGDLLYSVKTTIESVRANLTLDSAEQARLYLDFAKLRLMEMQSLIMRQRYDDISQAASEYERDVQKALRAVEHLSRADQMEAIALNAEIASILRIYRAALAQMLILVPEDKQLGIRSAIGVSQPAVGSSDDDDGTAGSVPIPATTATSSASPTGTISQTPAGLTPEPTKENFMPTPVPSNNNNADTKDQTDDSGKDDSSGGNNGGSNSDANPGGDDDGDDGGEYDDGDDGGEDDGYDG